MFNIAKKTSVHTFFKFKEKVSIICPDYLMHQYNDSKCNLICIKKWKVKCWYQVFLNI